MMLNATWQPEKVYESFLPDLKSFFESANGRVKLIHEMFNSIGECAPLSLVCPRLRVCTANASLNFEACVHKHSHRWLEVH